MTGVLSKEMQAQAREAAHEELALVEHYCRCARLHLEVANDPVTTMDLIEARSHFAAALRAFSSVREAAIACEKARAREAAE